MREIMNRGEVIRLLVRRYHCHACNQPPGQRCVTMRHHPGMPRRLGQPTQPHESRWVQYRRDLAQQDRTINRVITIDPTDLLPGDIVVAVNDHDISGCHCDVLVTVKRPQ